MKNMRIRMKLLTSFVILILLTAAVGTVGGVGTISMNKADLALYEQQTVPLTLISNVVDHTQRSRVHLRGLVIYTGQPEELKSIEENIMSSIQAMDEGLTAYYEATVNPQARKLFEEAENIYYTVYRPVLLELIVGAKEGKSQEELLVTINDATAITLKMVENYNSCMELQKQGAKEAVDGNSALSRTVLLIIVAVIVVSVVFALILAIHISGMIDKPIKLLSDFFVRFTSCGDMSMSEDDKKNVENRNKDEIGDCIGAAVLLVKRLMDINEKLAMVAHGDLTADIQVLSEKDTLGISLSNMINSLGGMFSEIQTASGQVSSGSAQISQGAQQLAGGSSEQAASIEEFSNSLSDLMGKTKLNADNTSKAQEESTKAGANLEEAISSMAMMLEAMKGIDESSKRITKVIKVIDDIAFQTNILALNAAVEAARAGLHGKGFAVVADEVRNLASKSATAAKETAALIEGSSERVKEGNQIVERTNEILERVAVGARQSNVLLEEVSLASKEQAKSIAEINHGIEQISTVIQENSASAEQSAAAAQQMSAQSVTLDGILARFKLKSAASGSGYRYPNGSDGEPGRPGDVEKY